MELVGVGFVGAAFAIYLAIPGRIRRKRRQELGLPPAVKTKAPSGVDEEDWRSQVPPGYRSGGWSGTRYYGVRRRP